MDILEINKYIVSGNRRGVFIFIIDIALKIARQLKNFSRIFKIFVRKP